MPAQEIVLQPELGGRVVWQSSELVAGGRFKADQPILRIDPRDYQLAVESFRSQVNRAKLDLSIEAVYIAKSRTLQRLQKIVARLEKDW